MKSKLFIFTLLLVLISFSVASAFDPNNEICCGNVCGRIRNVCGSNPDDPNCYPNTCNHYSGSCTALPSPYQIWVFKCNGNVGYPYICEQNGQNFPTGSTKSICDFAEPCKTIQIDVTLNGVGKDWLVWVGYCSVTTTTTTTTTTTIPQPQTGSIKIFKFYDSNANGVWDFGESPISGWEFRVIGGSIDTKVYTNSNGYVIVNDLPYNFYQVVETLPSGWSATTPTTQYVLVNSPTLMEVRFGNRQIPSPPTTTTTIPQPQTGSIKIFKFYDSNANGVWDFGESPISGWEFTISSGSMNKKVYTNNNGFVIIDNLQVPDYYQIEETLPYGWENTLPKMQIVILQTPELVEVRFGNRQIPSPPTTTTTIPDKILDVGSLEVYPSSICRNADRAIEISVPVTLVSGHSDTITAKFYIEDNNNGWVYLGKETEYLNVGEKTIFDIEYNYDAYELSLGTHDVKVVVEDGERITRYSSLKIKACDDERDVSVGFIRLNPENPQLSDLVQATVPISLIDTPSLPQTVYVEARIDGRLVTTSEIKFYHIQTKDYQFYFEAARYGIGKHTIEVKAKLGSVQDSSMRSFIIGESSGFTPIQQHCLIIEDVWSDQKLKEGSNVIKARVRNCGYSSEFGINSRFTAFDKTFYGPIFALRPNEERDILFTVKIPEDNNGLLEAKIGVWNDHASDEVKKTFSIATGYPKIIIDKEYRARICSQSTISFYVINTGQIKDTFIIDITGKPSEWLSGYPKTVDLDSGEREKIDVEVNVPCDAKLGIYQFTVTAQGSPRYSVTSSLRVVGEPFSLTGLFAGINLGNWLMWLLALILLLLLLLLLLPLLFKKYKSKKKPERCMGPHGC